jgi:hypothetical protein
MGMFSKGAFTNYVFREKMLTFTTVKLKTRVRGQKMPKNANVICESCLKSFDYGRITFAKFWHFLTPPHYNNSQN